MKNNITRFYKIDLADHPSSYELAELIKEFLRPSEYQVLNGRSGSMKQKENMTTGFEGELVEISLAGREMNRDQAKQWLFRELERETGYRPEWGTLTGVRPVKMANELMDQKGYTPDEVRTLLKDYYYLNDEKADLVLETSEVQRPVTEQQAGRTFGLYIGIPFCPTRCIYCAFTSNQQPYSEVQRYLKALLKEIDAVGTRCKDLGIRPESVYLGGGTPTTLRAGDLGMLLSAVEDAFDMSSVREYCVEAGRPDTITADRLQVVQDHGVGRISINPQSMNDSTLEKIGRTHRSADIRKAFEIADPFHSLIINSDIIAGLPDEDYDMFMHTLREVIALGPQNITVHTLAVKRSSKLHEMDAEYHYAERETGRMVYDARRVLAQHGYRPYYMYRQKHMAGNFENVSYARPGTESVYNIRIMDEHQTIIALGAGGISKAYYGPSNRLERVPNVSNYSIYIERIDEMIERKNQKLYRPFEGNPVG